MIKKITANLACVVVLFQLAGCASTSVSNRQILVTEKIPRPTTIWVYDFVSNVADVPDYSTAAKKVSAPSTPQTTEQLVAGYKAGGIIADQLVDDLRAMGMSAARAGNSINPRINDIVIRGYILSVDEGSATKRVAIGFGSGASEMGAAVEGYQMTANGLRKLGSGNVQAGGSKSPGSALGLVGLIATANPAGLIVGGATKIYGEASGSSKLEGRCREAANEIAEQIKPRLQAQGWIP